MADSVLVGSFKRKIGFGIDVRYQIKNLNY
jgi:hypothetical protein